MSQEVSGVYYMKFAKTLLAICIIGFVFILIGLRDRKISGCWIVVKLVTHLVKAITLVERAWVLIAYLS